MPSGCETCPKCGEETLQPFKGRASCLRVTDCGYSEKREPSLRAQVARLEERNAALEAALRLVRKALRPNEIALSLNHPAIDAAMMERKLPYSLVKHIDAALSGTGEGWLPPDWWKDKLFPHTYNRAMNACDPRCGACALEALEEE